MAPKAKTPVKRKKPIDKFTDGNDPIYEEDDCRITIYRPRMDRTIIIIDKKGKKNKKK